MGLDDVTVGVNVLVATQELNEPDPEIGATAARLSVPELHHY